MVHGSLIGLGFHLLKPSYLWTPQILQLVSIALVGAAAGTEPSLTQFSVVITIALLCLASEPHVFATTSWGLTASLLSALLAAHAGVRVGLAALTSFYAGLVITIRCGCLRAQVQVKSYNLALALAHMAHLQRRKEDTKSGRAPAEPTDWEASDVDRQTELAALD